MTSPTIIFSLYPTRGEVGSRAIPVEIFDSQSVKTMLKEGSMVNTRGSLLTVIV